MIIFSGNHNRKSRVTRHSRSDESQYKMIDRSTLKSLFNNNSSSIADEIVDVDDQDIKTYRGQELARNTAILISKEEFKENISGCKRKSKRKSQHRASTKKNLSWHKIVGIGSNFKLIGNKDMKEEKAKKTAHGGEIFLQDGQMLCQISKIH